MTGTSASAPGLRSASPLTQRLSAAVFLSILANISSRPLSLLLLSAATRQLLPQIMNGPAYPIINRLRIPHGPHRLRDRRWPPVEPRLPHIPDSQPVASQPEQVNVAPNTISQDAGSTRTTTNDLEKTENSTGSAPAVIAGAEETTTAPSDPSIWEETNPSVVESEIKRTSDKATEPNPKIQKHQRLA